LIGNILEGKASPARNVVLANASCCFYILGNSKTLKDGVKLAAEIIDSGAAKNKLSEFKNFINSHK
ncbi:MAG: anthranilate phosphoribosyltransferase, partial [Candidatus Omnitrophica bacterium]|nr:anthranilate phosphoribosyltransferase [Candidatus Omnitrophota bacterium]